MKQQRKAMGGMALVRLDDAQRWHHTLFFTGLATELVRHLEPNFYRVSLPYINSIHQHLLLHAILLLWCDVSA